MPEIGVMIQQKFRKKENPFFNAHFQYRQLKIKGLKYTSQYCVCELEESFLIRTF